MVEWLFNYIYRDFFNIKNEKIIKCFQNIKTHRKQL